MSDETPDDPRLLEFALSIADAKRVDWEGARQSATDLDATLETLHAIETLAQAALRDDDGADAPAAFTWGPLRAIEKLGEGAFGEVWRAYDPALQRDVALKLRRIDAPGPQARWLDEARRLARVQHANVLTVHGADVHDGRAGLWSDLVRGRTLEELVYAMGPLSADEAVTTGARLCAALAAVHAAGLVHGDIKTRNIMREGRAGEARGAGRIVLMDFGAAHEASSGLHGGSAATPLYSAPELLAGGRPSVASDVYALGVVLYRLVTGAHPIEPIDMDDLRARAARGAFVPLRERRADLPATFVRAVERALASDPAQRFSSAAEFERALVGSAGSAGSGAPLAAPPRRRRGVLVAALLTGALLSTLTWWLAPRVATLFAPRFHVASEQPAVAVTSDVVLASDDRVADLGAALCALGDLDGDGSPEYAVASPSAHDETGEVAVYSLATDGRLVPRAVWKGEHPGDRFGWAIAADGDLDGDHRPDVAIAAIGSSLGATHAGAVYVYRGGSALPATPAIVLAGRRPMQDFGYALSFAGDIDGDGVHDLVVGAPVDDAAGVSAGRAYVYLGGAKLHALPDLELTNARAHSQFGIAVTDGVDTDGDGRDDIAVGANWDSLDGAYSGGVYLYRGGAPLDGTVDRVLHGPGEGAWFGTTLDGRADLDGDGDRDLVIGALHAGGFDPDAGSVRIHRGGPAFRDQPWRILRGASAGDEFGSSFASGDFNGDGRTDLAVGAHFATRGERVQGGLALYFGSADFDETCDAWIDGRQAFERFGGALATLPANGEAGCAGLLVSSAQHQSSGIARGGRLTRFTFTRYVIRRPRGDERVGAHGTTLAWSGAAPATIACSSDGGRTWRTVAPAAGGAAENTLTVVPPAGATRARWRVTPIAREVRGAVETADHAIAR